MNLWKKLKKCDCLALPALWLALFILLWQASGFAQGCPMCQEAAKAQAPHAQKALNQAILFLLVPPVVFMGGILAWAFRHRNLPLQK